MADYYRSASGLVLRLLGGEAGDQGLAGLTGGLRLLLLREEGGRRRTVADLAVVFRDGGEVFGGHVAAVLVLGDPHRELRELVAVHETGVDELPGFLLVLVQALGEEFFHRVQLEAEAVHEIALKPEVREENFHLENLNHDHHLLVVQRPCAAGP